MDAPIPGRIAVVHDWLLDYAGSERVLAEILACFPQADLFTLVDRMSADERAPFDRHRIRTSFLQGMPGIPSRLGYYLPLMPLAIEQIDVTGYDVIISSSHAVAKGVIVSPDAFHLSYVHSPMRYAWDLQFAYLQEGRIGRGLRAALLRWLLHRLRIWDHRSAAGVDAFVANSRFVARRILKAYRREAEVVYPPVDTRFFVPAEGPREEHYLAVSRLLRYKRLDLLTAAFARMPERRLLIVGDGPELPALRRDAPPNVEFLGHLPASKLRDRLQRARAFLFSAVEDFGIAPVEAMACGTPVIALRKGGAAEIVLGLEHESPTGVFFEEQTADAIVRAVETFEREAARIRPESCRGRAERFSPSRFRSEFSALVKRRHAAWHAERLA